MESLTGQVVDGKYRVGRSLGEGGMGAVYLAEHIGIGRHVALKIVRPELLPEPTAAERFKREARAAGGIQHRNVVNVTDFGIAAVGGREIAYLVMEQRHGQTLDDVLQERRTLPLRQVVDIVEQVASALAAAHAIGVVHRDLEPANIWLAADDRGGFRVTLLDFGIAKLRDDGFVPRAQSTVVQTVVVDDATESRRESRRQSLRDAATSTQVGESIGTPAYMSPEQCVGDAVDARSDIYSLGIAVFQLLAGELPFRGSTMELLRVHFIAEVPTFKVEAGIRDDIAQVIRRALSKDPGERFQSALWKVPIIWFLLISLSLVVSGPMAMASTAAIFEDVKHRPFVPITWRRAAIAVVGHDASVALLLVSWIRTSMSRYLAVVRRTKGNSIRGMLAFIDPWAFSSRRWWRCSRSTDCYGCLVSRACFWLR